ncbi:class I SAM-dependent methyltransferase [Microbacterium thalassium]|uniref:SAM-dependent methyltransferase n=1 Tax=Microbacterium thalassium TaxID=362649 RepID=A0A7X0FSA6_9MICO|nr:class I SAM-dependent methyltransferase [Microbacterium thalassium]MBB6392769.1 SAM-dependent methyltransferase [Microbacterium thalassium]GLK23000.1 16S RNA G1207 methylase RsmC [Microbacterium thalassium]
MTNAGWHDVAPADFWEERYAGTQRVWSGAVNQTMADVVSSLEPGRALDLGCGEGGDAVWLAEHGWRTTAVDISPTAIERAQAAASDLGLTEEQLQFEAADLSTWTDETEYDLVTASFLHSPVALSRTEILRAVAQRVLPGGHLLVIAHAGPPPWSRHHHQHEAGETPTPAFPTPDEQIAELALAPDDWTPVLAEVRRRDAVGPDGEQALLDDTVVLMRRTR